jgi:hypothetical protein
MPSRQPPPATRRWNGTRYVANVLPLTSGARRKAGVSDAAVATAFVNKAPLDLPSPPEAIAKSRRPRRSYITPRGHDWPLTRSAVKETFHASNFVGAALAAFVVTPGLCGLLH